MATFESPARSNIVTALHVSGGGYHSTTPVKGGAGESSPSPPHPPPAKRPSPPELELPKVFQSDCNNLCLKASHQHLQQQLHQQSSPPILRPRTSPVTVNNASPLMVRSLHVIPRPLNPRQLHNGSLLKMPLRQRPATAGVRIKGAQYSAACGSLNSHSPQLTKVVPSLSEEKRDYLLNNCFDFQEHEEEGALVVAECSLTPPKYQKEEENDSNSINRGSTSSGNTPPNKEPLPITPESKNEQIQCSDESQLSSSSPPVSSPQQHQQHSDSPNSSDGIDQMGDNNREQPLAGSSDEYSKERAPKRPSCRRNLAKELEKELTFRPELNQRSLKIASRSTRQNVPLLCRLTERRKQYVNGVLSNGYTFAPKINAHSVRLAQERAGKIQEVCYSLPYYETSVIAFRRFSSQTIAIVIRVKK